MTNLRKTLAAIALAAPLGAGCFTTTSCPDQPRLLSFELYMPDATLTALVDRCRQMQDCQPLCAQVYEDNYGNPHDGPLDGCALSTNTASGQDVVSFVAVPMCIGGRRPAGYRAAQRCGTALAAYLTEQAQLEAASVVAFADLLADLQALGAPAPLRRAMVGAAADEVRHARMCARLARRHGGQPTPTRAAPAARRSRVQVAIDNLVEGCVRETYGAVVAGYQSRAAGDPAIREAMAIIARDEARHAALSWKLHRWLWPQLSVDEQTEAIRQATTARAELATDAATDDDGLRDVAGLPDTAAAIAMLAALDAQVWAEIA